MCVHHVGIIDYDGCGASFDYKHYLENKKRRILNKEEPISSVIKNYGQECCVAYNGDIRRSLILFKSAYPKFNNHFNVLLDELDQMKLMSAENIMHQVNAHQDGGDLELIADDFRGRIAGFFDQYYNFLEKMSVTLFVCELNESGFNPGDRLTLLNGSVRQTVEIDQYNNQAHKNGLISDSLPRWCVNIKKYFPVYLSETSIGCNFTSSLDETDDDPRAIFQHNNKRLRDQSKLGLVMSQMHFIARKHPNDSLVVTVFDDRLIPKHWNGATHNIEKSFKLIHQNPVMIPNNVRYRPVVFDAVNFVCASNFNRSDVIGTLKVEGGSVSLEPYCCELIQGCGIVQQERHYFDHVLHLSQWEGVKEAFELLKEKQEEANKVISGEDNHACSSKRKHSDIGADPELAGGSCRLFKKRVTLPDKSNLFSTDNTP